MVWLVEKKTFYHTLDMGFERVRVPLRVKFEFEVKEGSLVSDSLTFETLFNKQVLKKRYPRLKLELLHAEIEKTVKRNILGYLNDCGFMRVD
ncbi:MAG: hypothetical protein PVI06_00325 [Desulfobacterales bacterium]